MFEAGSIIFRLQSIGKQVFQKDLEDVDAAAKKVTTSTTTAGKSTEELGKKQDETSKKTKGLGNELTNMSEKGKQAASTVGRSLLGVGATLIAVTALAVKSAIGWETAWAGVTKTIDATPEQLDQIEDGLRGLSKVLPATHDEIAAVAEAAGQLGVASKDVVGFTKTMIDLGETTNLSSDEAATAIAQMMNIMQTAPADVDRLGSALVALGNNGASTEKDIILMAQRIAGAGKTVGLTEAEVLSLANALASVGIDVEAGGSAISRIMIDIAKQVSTNGKDLAKWAEVAGMSTAQFSKAFKETPAQAINAFVLGLGKINAAGGDVFTTLDELGQSDIRVTNALLTMANSGDLLTESLETGTEAWADNIALSAEAAKRYETTAAKLQIMQNKVNDAAIDLGQVFLPPLIAATDAIGGLASAVGDAPEWAQELTGGLLLAVGAVALFGGALMIAIPKIVEFRLAVRTLATEMPIATSRLKSLGAALSGPWGIAILAAGVGVGILTNYLESLQATTEEVEAAFMGATKAADVFMVASQGKDAKYWMQWTSEVKGQLKDLPAVLQAAADQSGNLFARFDSKHFGAFDALKDMGVTLAGLAKTNLPDAQKGFGLLADETDGSRKQLWRLLSAMPEYRDALDTQAIKLGMVNAETTEAERKTILLELAQGKGKGAIDATTAAIEAHVAAEEEAIAKSEEWRKEISEQDAAFVDLTGAYDSVVAKNQAVAESTAEATASTKDSWETFYDGVTIAIGDYILELQKQVDAQNNWESNMILLSGRVSDAMLDELGKLGPEGAPLVAALVTASDEELSKMEGLYAEKGAAATGAFASSLEISAPVIAAAGAQLGQGAAAEIAAKLAAGTSTVAEVVKEYGLVIESTVPVVQIDTSSATGKLQALMDKWAVMPQVVKEQLDPRIAREANGGIVHFANGGVRHENHVAQFARAGAMRVWAEPETGGEAYIPLSPAKRTRSDQVMAETAALLGGRYIPAGAQMFAEGGVRSDTQIMSGRRPQPMQIEGRLELVDGKAYIRGVIQDTLR